MTQRACVLLSFLVLVACDRNPSAASAPSERPNANAPTESSEVRAAIDAPDRLAGDRDEDAWRKPDVVLSYLEVRPGMQVIDYFAGGGYFTELLSRAVGPQGHVIAYNNDPYQKYAADKPAQRYRNERLPNVVQVTSPPEQLQLEPESLDAALFVLSYHDLHWQSKDNSWPKTDPHTALTRLAAALKPGGVVVVIDHAARPGSDPATSVDALHRIDPAVIRRDFAAAGFTFEGESEAFRNPDDNYDVGVFEPPVRHKTDRVMYKFRKPRAG